MLDFYIYDYLVKKKLHYTARTFLNEVKVSQDPVAIDSPGGFLLEWWSMFWKFYNAKTQDQHSESAAEYALNVYIYDHMVKKKLHNTATTFMIEVKVSPDHVATDAAGGFLFKWWSVFWDVFTAMMNEKHSESAAEAQQGKEEEQMKQPNPMNTETSQPHMDAGTIHHGQIVHGRYQGGVSSALQQLQSRIHQTLESEVNLGASPRQLPVDPSTVYGQGNLQSKPGMGSAGLNRGVGARALRGWPLTGIDNMRQGLDPHVQKAFLQNQGQFQLSPQQQQQQQIMAQVQGQGNMTNSSMYGDMDPRRYTGFPRANLNSEDGRQNANDGYIGSPMLSSSSKLINMPPVQQASSQQQDPLLSQQSNRKRTRTGNTVGPSNSQPSTPSTHTTPVEGVAITANMQHVNNMPKGPMMYGSDSIGGLASSANQLTWDDVEAFEDVGALEDNVELSFLQDDRDGLHQDNVEALDEDLNSLLDILERNPSILEPQQGKVEEQQIQMEQPNPMNTETLGTNHHGNSEMVQWSSQGGGESRKRCSCKKSKCLKLFCECFASGVYCTTEPPCSCIDCFNKPIHEDTTLATARNKIKSRVPLAFTHKVRDDASKTLASALHIRGCNCKKSNCSSNYCHCFQGGVRCSTLCRCQGCANKIRLQSALNEKDK